MGGIFVSDRITVSLKPAWTSNSKLVVNVTNQSGTDIHNATILLCVRFTDMFKGDFITFPAGDAVAVLKSGETMEVGRQKIGELTKDQLGKEKEWKDVIEYGAVLISDEAITWVAPQKLDAAPPPPAPAQPPTPAQQQDPAPRKN